MGMILTRRYNVDRFGYLIPHRYGNVPMVGAVATYRPSEGRFGGAVAVEEGTTNLVPSSGLKFEGWSAFSGAQVTLTQNVEFPEIGRNDATRIRTTGGTPTLKYYLGIETSIADQAYTGSVYIKNIGSKPVRFYTQLGPIVTVNPGEWTRAIVSGIGDGILQFQLRFEALNVDDDLDFVAWGPQGERKPFATSFVDGTRAAGVLTYDASIMPVQSATVAAWVWVPPSSHWPTTTWRRIISNANDFVARTIALYLLPADRKLYLELSDDSDMRQTISSPSSVAEGWHHVAATWDASRMALYVDGSLVAQRTNPSLPTSHPNPWIAVGARTDGIDHLNGLIDELLILPYAASEEEIVSWYEAQGPLPPHPQASLQWDRQTVRPAQMVKL